MIRRILLASAGAMALTGAALAADLRPPPPAPPPYWPLPWTGFYVGLNAGYEWSDNVSVHSVGLTNLFDPPGGVYQAALVGVGTSYLPISTSGFIGGGQAGYNFQFPNNTVAGLEVDFQGIAGASSSATGSTFTPVGNGDSYSTALSAHNRLDYLGTLRGRYGYLFTPTLLVYGTGGFAYGGSFSSASFAATDAFGLAPVFGGSSLYWTAVGWAAGGGLEWMFLPHWTVKVEYLAYDLTKQTSSFGYLTQNVAGAPFATALTHFTVRPQGNVVRVGLNYLFNWGEPPVVAKY
jgi:outer membrane immunogenic protein